MISSNKTMWILMGTAKLVSVQVVSMKILLTGMLPILTAFSPQECSPFLPACMHGTHALCKTSISKSLSGLACMQADPNKAKFVGSPQVSFLMCTLEIPQNNAVQVLCS